MSQVCFKYLKYELLKLLKIDNYKKKRNTYLL